MTKPIKNYATTLKLLRPMIISLLLLASILYVQKRIREEGPRNLQGLFDTLGGSQTAPNSHLESANAKNFHTQK